ncbi:MAG: bile acid:sodium symporter family protein [Spirochaetales bacterium]|nr:bile acid:sodium symporter family protein [Spirochaetales bacterium]
MFIRLFPLWLLFCTGLALYHPPLVVWFKGDLIPLGLGMIMLGMGLTLTFADFERIFRLPTRVLAGFVIQYTVMPLCGFLLAHAISLPLPLATGLILVACCPGGTASNVIAFLARADVPLSVTLTALSTLLAALITPAWTYVLTDTQIDVSFTQMSLSTATVVVLPVLLGLLCNAFLPALGAHLQKIAGPVAVVFICLIVASITAQNQDAIFQAALPIFFAALCLHALGFAAGYALMWLLFRNHADGAIVARTVSIETGMQNSGLAVFLALKHFSDPLTALPGALSSVIHSLIGSALAWHWSRKTVYGSG